MTAVSQRPARAVTAPGARPSPRLRTEEAVPLLHAVVGRVAEGLGVRALAVKGPVVALQGLRAPRSSADADVLVHPDEQAELVEGLLALGWRESVPQTTARVMPAHAVNLLHDHWPVGIDVHHYFPGFLADPVTVFDTLWARRDHVTLAGVPIPAVDRVGHVALVGLHLLRAGLDVGGRAGAQPALEDLVDRARRLLTPKDIDDLVQVAEQTDATATLRDVLLALGVPADQIAPARDREALELWQRRVHAAGSAPWLMLLGRTPLSRWPATAWHALMLTEDEIYAMHNVVPGEVSLARLRARRLRRAVARMPVTVRSLNEVRRVRG